MARLLGVAPMDLGPIRARLSAAAHAHRQGNLDALSDAVRSLAGRGELGTMLETLGEDPVSAEAVGARSYYHANRFVKITLLSDSDYKLRLHLWWPTSDPLGRERTENVHNHRWDFATCLLAGGYRYQEYRTAEHGETYFAYRYRSPGATGAYPLDARGTAELACVFDAAMVAGTAYTVRAEELHRVVQQGRQLTASLMLQSQVRRTETDVFATCDLGPRLSVPVPALTGGQLTGQLRRFLDAW